MTERKFTISAQAIINCQDLSSEAAFFTDLGFQIITVFPADDPRVMQLLGHGMSLRLEKNGRSNNWTLQLTSSEQRKSVVSPHGVTVQFQVESSSDAKLPSSFDFGLNHFDPDSSWVTGRAGMLYRDLIPSRLGGAIIASNILIPDGGPVPDQVHFHSIQFQLIFCVKGWVKVVYEDQGEPFVLRAGDCVTQPTGIRHQVLEASDGMEVLEIGLPAEHMTTLDHDMQLPTGKHNPDRWYGETAENSQQFCHHRQANAHWQPWPSADSPQLLTSQTQVEQACGGIAAVRVYRCLEECFQKIEFKHPDKLRFYFLLAGQANLENSSESSLVQAGDSWILPPGEPVVISQFAKDFQCIEFILR